MELISQWSTGIGHNRGQDKSPRSSDGGRGRIAREVIYREKCNFDSRVMLSCDLPTVPLGGFHGSVHEEEEGLEGEEEEEPETKRGHRRGPRQRRQFDETDTLKKK